MKELFKILPARRFVASSEAVTHTPWRSGSAR